MGKFAIVATLDIAQGRVDEVLPILIAHRARCLKDEPGTLQFEVLKPHSEADKILLYEVYDDEAAFRTHWEGASLAQAQAEANGLILKISGVRCTPQE